MYDLFAFVVHCGSGPNRGHYISMVKSHGLWLLFDDDVVEVSPPIYSVYILGKKRSLTILRHYVTTPPPP